MLLNILLIIILIAYSIILIARIVSHTALPLPLALRVRLLHFFFCSGLLLPLNFLLGVGALSLSLSASRIYNIYLKYILLYINI